MSRKRYSALRKILAALLSFLIAAGTLVVVPVVSGAAKEATPDEASPRRSLSASSAANQLVANDGVNTAVKNNRNYYFDIKNLKTLEVEFKPMSSSFDASETDKITFHLGEPDIDILKITKRSEGYEIKKSGDTHKLTVDLKKALGEDISTGKYQLALCFDNAAGNEVCQYTANFEVLESSFDISDLTFSNNGNTKWTEDDVIVSFTIDREIIDTVKYNDGEEDVVIEKGEDGKYSFKAVKSADYKIIATDKFGYKAEKQTGVIKKDSNPPIIETPLTITKANSSSTEDMTGKWVSGDLKVAFKLSDSESGVKDSSVKVNGKAADGSDGSYSFTADSMKDYVIEYEDNTGNKGSYTLGRENVKVDKVIPQPEDVTITFSADESDADAALRKLTFGLYDNRKVYASVDVEDGGLSPIISVSLKNGTTELSGTDNRFELPVLSTDDGKYDLNVSVSDEAGNSATYNMLSDSVYVKIKNKDKVEELLNDASRKSFEVIISEKIKPEITSLDASGKTVDNEIAAGSVVAANVKDEVAGIKEAFFTMKKESGEDSDYTELRTFTADEKSKKTTASLSYTIPKTLESGKYVFRILAVNNCGNTEILTKTFTVDNVAPEIDEENIIYGDNADKEWANKDVNVSLSISDDLTGVKKVTYRKAGESGDGTIIAPVNKVYTFKATEYGAYVVTVLDKVGNKSEITTKKILIDKEKPQLDGSFSYSTTDWTNKPVKVDFKLKDYPDNSTKSGIDSVTVDGEEVKVSKGSYSFDVSEYGTKTVTVADNAGNTASFETDVIKYDDTAPSVTEVAVENGKTYSSFGVYSNEELAIVFTVKNDGSNPSPLDGEKAITLLGNNTDLIKFVKSEDGKYYYKVSPEKAAKIITLKFNVRDTAGNVSKNYTIKPKDKTLSVQIAEDLDDEIFSILCSYDDAEIQEPEITGLKNAGGIYGGESGVIKSKFTDNTAGIKAVKVEFGKVKLGDDPAKAELEDVTSKATETVDFSADKVKEVPVSFETPKLTSGRYILRLKVRNNADNYLETYKEILVDNDAPVIKSVRFSGDIANADNRGVYASSAVKVSLTIDDSLSGSVTSSGITDVKLVHKDGTLSENAGKKSGADIEFTLDVNNSKAYTGINFTVEDELGNGKDVNLPITGFKPVADGKEITPTIAFEVVASDVETNIENITEKSGDKKNVFEGVSYDLGEPYISEKNVMYVNKDGDIFVTFRDSLSGIDVDKTVVTINGKKIANPSVSPTMIGSKVGSAQIKFNTADVYPGGIPDGEYELEYTVFNNSGVSVNRKSSFVVDKTAPVVESINFAPADKSAAENLFNVLTFGLFSNNDVKVTLTISDKAPSAGISDSGVTLESLAGSKVTPAAGSFAEKDGVYTKDFTLSATDDVSKSNYKDLTFKVSDNLKNEIVAEYHSTDVSMDGADKSVDDKFDIILNNSDSTVKLSEDFDKDADIINDGFKFEGFDYSKEIDNVGMYSDNKTGNGTVTAEFYDELTGVSSIEASISIDGGEAERVDLQTSSLPVEKNVKAQAKADISALKIESGRCKLTFKVKNNAGNTKEFSVNFGLNVDEKPPVLEKVLFRKESSAADKVLNLLTFGLYSNDNIIVDITAYDEVPSSRLATDGIKLSNDSNGSLTAITKTEASGEDPEKEYFTRSYRLKRGNEHDNSFFNELKITLTDKFNNSTGIKPYSQNNKVWAKLDSGEEKLDATGIFSDIVASSEKPVISNVKVEPKQEKYHYTEDGTYEWYNGNDGNFIYSAIVSDSTSKLQKIQLFLEYGNTSKDITEYASFTNISGDENSSIPKLFSTNGVFTNPSTHQGNKYDKILVRLDSKKLRDNGVKLEEGQVNILIKAWSNNVEPDNSNSVDESYSIHVDSTAPVITNFSFESKERSYNSAKPGKSNSDKPVEETDFGYFFKEDTKVTVTAEDIEGGVGVKSITYYLVDDSNGDETVEDTKRVGTDNSITFDVSASFKGRIYAKATDLVSNEGKYYNPKDVVAEDKDMHSDETSIDFTLESTPYKDINGRNLYAGSTTVRARVESAYAGIAKIAYSVIAPNGKQSDNYEAQLEVPKNCRKISEVNGWTINVKERNLASVMSGDIKVNNDSNDIAVKVTVTDRAGYTSTKTKKLSIDKTAPRIEVKYDNNTCNTLENTDYYNKDRTATVTVYERNFNAENFKANIKNTLNGKVPSEVEVSDWSKPSIDTKNPDNTAHVVKYTFHDDGDYEVGFDCKDIVKNAAKTYGTDKFTIDETKPEISISFDNNSSANGIYYNADRTATITIREHNFWAGYVEIAQNGADDSFSSPTFSETSADTWTASVRFSTDGNYAFTVNFKDRALNEAEQQSADRFYIDKTKGKIEFLQVQNEQSYGGTIAPVVKFTDSNFDTKKCEVTKISLDTENYGEKDEFNPNLTRSDGGSTFNYSDFPHEVSYDGVYRMKASLVDKAGNTTEESIVFSVNRFGSTFVLLDKASDTLVHQKHYTNDAPDLVISEINVDTISKSSIKLSRNDDITSLSQGKDYKVVAKGAKNKWHRYDYVIDKANFDSEGKYTVTLTTTDYVKKTLSNRTAYKNNVSGDGKIDRTCPVSFVVDKTAPNIVISGIESDGMYEEASKKVNIICEDANIKSDDLSVKYDGKELSKNDYVVTESSGTIEISTNLDADGNTAQRSFTVSISDKAGNVGKGEVKDFYLSATWFARLIHYHLGLIIAIAAVILAGIGFGLFMLTKKRKRENNQ